jgi:probable F420-dependent oxidoreductase
MDAGVAIFLTDETVRPDEVARMTEERGFDSLWVPEHTHMPAVRSSPFPPGGPLPREYARMLDPFVALTAAAAATQRIKLGFGVCLVAQHDPIITAKAVATLDLLSEGRVLFGVGAGWNREEMRDHGVDPSVRMRLMRERVEAMRTLWTDDEGTYTGSDVVFERAWSWPKPVQRPHPLVLIGGYGPTVEERVLGFGDGWLPNLGDDDRALLDRVARLRRRGEAEGRSIPVTVNKMIADPVRLGRLAEAGIERVVFYLPPSRRDAIEARFEEIERALRDVR